MTQETSIQEWHQKIHMRRAQYEMDEFWDDLLVVDRIFQTGDVGLCLALQKAFQEDGNHSNLYTIEEFYEAAMCGLEKAPCIEPVLEQLVKGQSENSFKVDYALVDTLSHNCPRVFVWCFEQHVLDASTNRPLKEDQREAYQTHVRPFDHVLEEEGVPHALYALMMIAIHAQTSMQKAFQRLDNWWLQSPLLRDTMSVLVHSDIQGVLNISTDIVEHIDTPNLHAFIQKRALEEVVSNTAPKTLIKKM